MTTATTVNDSKRIVVDSSGWLEYLTDDVNADRFAPYVAGNFDVIVPTIVVYEVYKKLLMESGKSAADAFASNAMRRTVVPLDDVTSDQRRTDQSDSSFADGGCHHLRERDGAECRTRHR